MDIGDNSAGLGFLSSASALYGVKYQCRCVAPQLAEHEAHRFLVGTTSLSQENEVHLIEFDEDHHEVVCRAQFHHASEVWDLKPCPFDKSLFFTCYNTGFEREVSLWKMPPMPSMNSGSLTDAEGMPLPGEQQDDELCADAYGTTVPKLKEVLKFAKSTLRDQTQGMLWEPTEEKQTDTPVVSLHEHSIRLWSLQRAGTEGTATKAVASTQTDAARTCAGSWDPINLKQIVTASGTSIHGWDLRTMKETHHITNAHKLCVRDIDFNTNKPWAIVSGGDDGVLRFWDLRKPSGPTKALAAHKHWVTCARFNPNHDQLLLSASTDHMVKLWRVSSISSAPLLELDNDTPVTAPDMLVKTFDEHEDSVYSVAWSACEPWVFASLSFDGRIVVGSVPSAEKYKILL